MPLVTEQVVVDPDPYWRQEIVDRLAALRTALVVVGLLAAIALGVGVWALIELGEDEDGSSGRRAASASRVSAINNRVDALEQRLGELPAARDIQALSRAQQDLADRVAAAERAARDAAASGGDQQVRSAITDLQTDFEGLDRRIDALEQSAQGGATP